MPFLNDLFVKSIRGSSFYELTLPLSYQHNDTVYTAPVGFKTDFASIPKAVRGFIDEDESDIRDAAVIHDWLYSTGELPRSVADIILRDAMRELGAGFVKASVVFLAVRCFGSSHFGAK